jgi:hypothetical protein
VFFLILVYYFFLFYFIINDLLFYYKRSWNITTIIHTHTKKNVVDIIITSSTVSRVSKNVSLSRDSQDAPEEAHKSDATSLPQVQERV